MIRICTPVKTQEELDSSVDSDIFEIDANLFPYFTRVNKPVILSIKDNESLLKWKDPIDEGYIEIGRRTRPITKLKVISSVYNRTRTIGSNEIADMLNGFNCDIAKGVFKINRPEDLLSLYDASKLIEKKHILLGTGEMGAITRLRPNVLGNEFGYAHPGEKLYSGQLSAAEMREMGDDSIILGLVGHPLTHSVSKIMQTHVLNKLGIKGCYLNFDTVTIEGMDEVIRRYDIRGVNVTLPFKTQITAYLDHMDTSATETGAVNTILNSGSKLVGSNTDVDGALYAVKKAGFSIDGDMRVLIMGSGGAAMACAYMFTHEGADVSIIGRNRNTVREVSKRFGCIATEDKDPVGYDMIVNCTPIGMYSEESYPADVSQITSEQAVFDVTYGTDTVLKKIADERGCRTVSGLDMLIGQGRRSFEIWTGKLPEYDMMKESVS